MRPSDENQQASTRPNLMEGSSRKGGNGNDYILAALERDGMAEFTLAREPRISAFVIAAAGAVVLVLLFAGFAWLFHDKTVPLRPAYPAADAALLARFEDRPEPAAQAQAATIYDVRAAQEIAGAARAPATGLAVEPVLPITPASASASPAGVAPALTPAPHRSRPGALAKKMQGPAPTLDPRAVDSDVTLLTAIVAHTSNQAFVDGQCSGTSAEDGKCPAKPASRPGD